MIRGVMMTRQSWVVRCSTILFARYGAYHGLLYPSRRGHVVSSSSSSNKCNKLVRQYYWCSPVSSSSSSSSSQPNHAWSSGTVTSNRQELDIHDTTTISGIDEAEPNDSSTLHTTTDKILPEFVHNVTAWFDHLNISYDLCQVPLSTMVPLSEAPTYNITLYVVRLMISPSTSAANTTVTSTHSPPIRSWLLLHLIPSPTSLETSIPAGVTQFMTDHPHEVWWSIPGSGETDHYNVSTMAATQLPIIHLHEDIWRNERTHSIVQLRLLFRLGAAVATPHRRLYARKTVVQRIDRITAQNFLLRHHLWGTTYSKYSYGLFDPTTKSNDCINSNNSDTYTERGRLVAVATFSSGRSVHRGQGPEKRIYHSYELIRTCSCGDTSVMGGISKLISAFIKDHSCTSKPVDDVVTVIDRDWGIGQSNWHTLGFTTVATMLPIPMAIKSKDGSRRHLIGGGIQNEDDANVDGAKLDSPLIRYGLPKNILHELESINSFNEAKQCLHRHGYYLIYDAGVERLFLLASNKPGGIEKESIQSLWKSSIPQYATRHYSNNSGIDAIIQHVAKRNYTC